MLEFIKKSIHSKKLRYLLVFVITGLIITSVIYLQNMYKGVLKQTETLNWLIKHTEYSPKIELNIQKIVQCSNNFKNTNFKDVYQEDDAILSCYNKVNTLLLNIAPYKKWELISTGINNLYAQMSMKPEDITALTHTDIYKSSIEFTMHPEIKKKLIKNMEMLNALMLIIRNKYEITYNPRVLIPEPTESYFFEGNSLELYVACLNPYKIGFKSRDECIIKLPEYDYAQVITLNNQK